MVSIVLLMSSILLLGNYRALPVTLALFWVAMKLAWNTFLVYFILIILLILFFSKLAEATVYSYPLYLLITFSTGSLDVFESILVYVTTLAVVFSLLTLERDGRRALGLLLLIPCILIS